VESTDKLVTGGVKKCTYRWCCSRVAFESEASWEFDYISRRTNAFSLETEGHVCCQVRSFCQ
jgi:hypothetical protein